MSRGEPEARGPEDFVERKAVTEGIIKADGLTWYQVVAALMSEMRRNSELAVVYREQFLANAGPRNSSYLQAKVREQHDGLVIIELSSYLDTGGAHGTPGRGFINYSRQQHKVLNLSDMLMPGQEEAFWKAAQVAHNSWLISTKLDQEPEFVKSWPFVKTPHVALTYGGVILKYEVSTIAPYALGHVELKIPYPRLNGILKPELFPGRN